MRLVRQGLAFDHFVLELDVSQLLFQLLRIGALDHLCGWIQGKLKHEVVVKSLGVEDAVVGQDLVVESDSVQWRKVVMEPCLLPKRSEFG